MYSVINTSAAILTKFDPHCMPLGTPSLVAGCNASCVRLRQGSWEGARVLSPFRYPQLVSLVTVAVTEPERLPGADRWRQYRLTGPSPDADTAFHKLHVRLAGQPNTLPTIKLEADQASAPEHGAVPGDW